MLSRNTLYSNFLNCSVYWLCRPSFLGWRLSSCSDPCTWLVSMHNFSGKCKKMIFSDAQCQCSSYSKINKQNQFANDHSLFRMKVIWCPIDAHETDKQFYLLISRIVFRWRDSLLMFFLTSITNRCDRNRRHFCSNIRCAVFHHSKWCVF